MELNENLERRGRCKLPVSEREVAMPRASARFVHDSKVPGLLCTILSTYKVIFIKMRQTEVSFLKIPKFRMECYPL